uniref:Gamma-glutamyltransferase n=1 Tax=Pardosa pseudoannulata TaxID=330961 RepID=A0A223PJT8_9ARAC|nr:gamma-glutamyltransferase [Pardosa pseudoannulata]
MCSVFKHFGSGKLTMEQILEPAFKIAEKGVPVGLKTSLIWNKFKDVIKNSKQAEDILQQGRTVPLPGEKVYAPKLAHIFKLIASDGKEGFYCGTVAQNIVKEVERAGGVLTLNDMKEHLTFKLNHELQEPLFIDFCGFRIWEMKPNTIGIVVLVALNILQLYDLRALGHNSAEYIHIVSEVVKYAYLECWDYLCDPSYNSPCFKSLLSENLSIRIKMQIDDNKASNSQFNITGSNTSYVGVVDEEGNGCSFICSISSDFGTGLIPEGCGFTLHDRLKSMSLNESSPNAFGPKKVTSSFHPSIHGN